MYGLREDIVNAIVNVFKAFPEVEAAILYGSRAKGNFKPASDIDLTIKGENLDLSVLNKISWQLDDLLLPYKFDLSVFEKIQDEEVIDHIQRVGKIFYTKTA